MPRYKMVVSSYPVAGREAEYNDWYQNIHLGELVSLKGFVSARRFRLAAKLVEGEAAPYMAIYEIETDDVEAVLEHLKNEAYNSRINMSEAIDTSRTTAVVYEEFGDVVSAP